MLATPEPIKDWSLTSLKERPITCGLQAGERLTRRSRRRGSRSPLLFARSGQFGRSRRCRKPHSRADRAEESHCTDEPEPNVLPPEVLAGLVERVTFHQVMTENP